MADPAEILNRTFHRASRGIEKSLVKDTTIRERIEYVAQNLSNRAGARLLMACLLAKAHAPHVDIRKPYTEIGGEDVYSGRAYDERYITGFVHEHNLPCNSTTAFLTPALRNRNSALTTNLNLVGRPPQLYHTVLLLLDDVYHERVSASDMLAELIRSLLVFRNERIGRIESLIRGLKPTEGGLPLSSEQIVTLIWQHMQFKGTSRLPVLAVAAAYEVAQKMLGERVLSLHAHNAADIQTGALGDVEITLQNAEDVVTVYEIKNKRIVIEDVQRAVQKLVGAPTSIDNYVFITTENIDEGTQEYARSLYEETGGIEFIILDCLGFIRHFLHLFHRLRTEFLETYQQYMLDEPESAVSQPVKEAFLAMRQAAESGE